MTALMAEMETSSMNTAAVDKNAGFYRCSALAAQDSCAMQEGLIEDLTNELQLEIASAPAVVHDGSLPSQKVHEYGMAHLDLCSHGDRQDIVKYWLAFDDLHAKLQEYCMPVPEVPGLQDSEVSPHTYQTIRVAGCDKGQCAPVTLGAAHHCLSPSHYHKLLHTV